MHFQSDVMNHPQTYGDTTRYYELMFYMICTCVALLAPIYVYETYSVWLRMRFACTAEGGVVQKMLLKHMCLNCFLWYGCGYWTIPTSLELLTAHGGGPGLSGAYVGMHFFGAPMIFACRFVGPVVRLDWNAS